MVLAGDLFGESAVSRREAYNITSLSIVQPNRARLQHRIGAHSTQHIADHLVRDVAVRTPCSSPCRICIVSWLSNILFRT